MAQDEGALTRCRHERKLALDPALAAELERQVQQRRELPPAADTCVTSVYFDLADGRLSARALAHPTRCVKVRTKEYAPDLSGAGSPRCVVEIKRRRGTLTRKVRQWIERRDLLALFGAIEPLPGDPLAPAIALVRERLFGLVGGALHPLVAVTYLRRVYPIGPGIRLTFDRELAFHVDAPELLLGAAPLGPSRLSAPVGREPRWVVELKYLGPAVPAWAAPLLAAHESGFSKFGAAVALLGRRASRSAQASG